MNERLGPFDMSFSPPRACAPLVRVIVACMVSGLVASIGLPIPSVGQHTSLSPTSPSATETVLSRNAPSDTLSVGPLEPSAPQVSDTEREQGARTYRPQRLWWGVGTAAALDVGGMVLLHQFWYSNTERTTWHFYDRAGGERWYDDWFTYKQQDKLGHLYSSWALSRAAIAYGHWSGLSRRNAAVFGMGSALFFHAQIEFFDGFSERYGASRTDLLANAAGSAIAGLQHLYPRSTSWFALKYSYHPSPYYEASRFLGNGIQDYQGITFWLSLRPERMLPNAADRYWPDWLAVSVGHSGVGLGHPVSGVGATPEHRRQLHVGPDIVVGELVDLPDSWSALEQVLSFVRLPLPALQIAPNTEWHWAHF